VGIEGSGNLWTKKLNLESNTTMNHQYLAAGQEVNVVDPSGKPVKATITQVMGEHVARVEYDNGKHAVVAPFSDKKEPGTFHFAEASAKPELTSEAQKKG
jgi:hypothetical protein